jgi:lysyl-tRNA synthetase class 2
MLEWYRKNEPYQKIMEDIEHLISFLLREGEKKKIPVRSNLKSQTLVKRTMQDLFFEFIGVDILNFLDVDSIRNLCKKFPEIPLPTSELEWDDYFFLIYLNLVEPHLIKYPFLLIDEFPAPLSALSTIKSSNPKVCERFEVYINGVEICNCFNELTDVKELEKRFRHQNQLKKNLYSYQLPEPLEFYSVMENGYPRSSGIALGIERILKALFEIENPFFH